MEDCFQKAQNDNLPQISDIMIAEFINSNQHFISTEIRGAKADRSTRDSYAENAIGYVQVKREGDLCTVKGQVTPEHKVRKKNYSVTLTCDEKERVVLSVQCEGCAAKLGGCKHALAFLFWTHRKSSEPSTTEVQSYWKKSKLSCVGTSQKFMYVTEMGKKNCQSLPPKNPAILEQFMELVNKRKINDLQLCNNYSPLTVKEKLSLHFLKIEFVSQKIGKTCEEFWDYISTKMTDELCLEAATASMDQSKNPIWHELRYGRITASKAYEASRCSTFEGCLVESIFGAKFKPTAAINRGKKLEAEVLKVVQKKHKIEIKKCGLLLDSTFPVLGASPDGITNDFVVEIKCPTSQATMDTYFKDGSPASRHEAQLQLQMLFAKKSKGLFCVAHPDFEETRAVSELWVDFDEAFCKDILSKILKFWYVAIFPRI